MKYLALLVCVLALVGCAAEGELDDVDAGITTPDGGSNPSNNAGVDGGTDNVDPNVSPNIDPGDASNELCDPLAPACPQGEKCVPNTTTGQSVCVAATTNNPVGDSCSRTTDCVEGAACVNDGGVTTCRELCDSADVDSCAGAATFCTQTLGSNSSLGVCAPAPTACSIYDQDCASGDCVLLRNPVDDTIGTYCGEAGSVAVGGRCGNGNGSCSAGSICIQAGADTNPTCHAVCRDGDLPCASGACTGTSSSGVDFCV